MRCRKHGFQDKNDQDLEEKLAGLDLPCKHKVTSSDPDASTCTENNPGGTAVRTE